MRESYSNPERMKFFQRRDEVGEGWGGSAPVETARRQRRLDAVKTLIAGALWIAAVWGGILLVFWGLAR